MVDRRRRDESSDIRPVRPRDCRCGRNWSSGPAVGIPNPTGRARFSPLRARRRRGADAMIQPAGTGTSGKRSRLPLIAAIIAGALLIVGIRYVTTRGDAPAAAAAAPGTAAP